MSSFNSRTPCGVRHACFDTFCIGKCFNSRTPCGVRRMAVKLFGTNPPVSIHAPRVGCDYATGFLATPSQVSIHAPRVGCDLIYSPVDSVTPPFQFTHPVWGATTGQAQRVDSPACFNSRTPCGVRPLRRRSIWRLTCCFNSRTPCGVRLKEDSTKLEVSVSIHAPRVGCDSMMQSCVL